jgi:hypothetical protein
MKKNVLNIVFLACALLLYNGLTAQQKKNTPKGYINGKFSIAAGKQIYFSKGDLQYQPSTKTWRFALHQYDVINEDNVRAYHDSNYQGWMDMFYWGQGDDPLSGVNYDHHYIDYGTNTISNGGGKGWRTLSAEEWECILFKRETPSGMNFVKAKVDGIYGLIVFPDDWQDSYFKVNNINGKAGDGSSNTISKTDWTKLEAKGAVFLPSRNGYISSGVWAHWPHKLLSVGYWTSSSYKHKGFALWLDCNVDYEEYGFGITYDIKDAQHPVRLVCPVK